MDLTELRKRAQTIGRVPEQYNLKIEELLSNSSAKAVMFCWADPAEEQASIMVILDAETGTPRDLSIFKPFPKPGKL